MEYGTQNESGYWVNGSAGLQAGFKLKDELAASNALTIPEIMEFASKKHKDKPCFATRELLKREKIKEGEKTFEKLEQGKYVWSSYENVQKQVVQVSEGMKKLGFGLGDRVAILAETRADWYIGALGSLRQGIVIVTVYTNLSDSGLVHAMKETEVKTVFASYDLLPRLIKVLPQLTDIEKIIVMEDQLEGIGNTSGLPESVQVMGMKELLKTSEGATAEPSVPKPDDLAIIMYTSGSTGSPKGVEITHKNIMCALTGYLIRADFGEDARYISFLPLAHVMELSTEAALMVMGVGICYSSPFTLSNNSPKVKAGTLGDARVAQPTAMSAVPLILDRIIKGVTQNVEKQGNLKKLIFKEAVKYKKNNETSFGGKLLDKIIFSKVKAELGGQLRSLVVGGSPLSPQTHTTIRTIFGCTLQVGYGTTETAASVSSMIATDSRPGNCGPVNLGVYVYLEDWEEGGYKVTDKPQPRGELIIGGDAVTRGYYKMPVETSESFFEKDGIRWFRTGDIGEFDETGCLRIIDRKKDLVKLKHGEYVSLGNIEALIKTQGTVDNICVVADSNEDCTLAIVVPNYERLLKLATSTCEVNDETSCEDLCRNEKVAQALAQELKIYGKKQGLTRWDIPAAVILTSDIWLPETGLVTAALKLKRNNIKNKYQEQIKKTYLSLKTK